MKIGKIRVRWKNVLLGTGIGMLVLVCCCAAAAGLMAKGVADLAQTDLFVAGILALASLCGCLTAMLGGGTPLDAAITAAGLLVVLMVLNIGINGGEMEGLAVTALVLAGGCGGAILLAPGRISGRTPHRRRRKIVNMPKSRRR